MEGRPKSVIALFDIDGTLTPSRLSATPEIINVLKKLKNNIYIGIVGGSDYEKQKEQLGDDVLELVDYSFPENGLVAYEHGTKIHSKSILDFLGEENLQMFINWALRYIADLNIPKKRGTFIEYRTGLINICPIGRNCSQEERDEFFEYDKCHQIRKKMVEQMEKSFKDRFNISFSIGGQISIDCFPSGWDKSYCLQHIKEFTEIHFFGDKTMPGGNDYEIFNHSLVKGHTVTDPSDTIRQIIQIFNIDI